MRNISKAIAKFAVAAVLAATVAAPLTARAAEIGPVVTSQGPWAIATLAKDTASSRIEAYKIDRQLVAWTEVSGTSRTLYAFDGVNIRTLATMPVSDWKDDGAGFYGTLSGSFDVADGHVVWTANDGSDREIYDFDGDAVKKISDNSYDDRHPVTSRGRIAWTSQPGSSYILMVKDGFGTRKVDGFHVTNYAFSGPNLYWLNKLPNENWFRVFVNVGLATAPVGEGDDRPIDKYFFVDGKGGAAWEYSTKRWDYDKRVIYASINGAPAFRALQRDVPPNVTRLEDYDNGRTLVHVTDLLYQKLIENTSLLDVSGVNVATVYRKEATSKVRFMDGGYVRHREPKANIALVFTGGDRQDFVTQEPVIRDRFDADGPTVAGARVGGGLVVMNAGETQVFASNIETADVTVKNGDIAWLEGAEGARTLKSASKTVLVRGISGAEAQSGHLVKSSGNAAVYLAAKDGKRYVFSSEGPYFSWYKDFSTVRTVSPATLAGMPIGGTVLYKPGSRLLKSASSPKVYAIGNDGIIHWVTAEDVVVSVFGKDWKSMLDTVDDAMISVYRVGEPIGDAYRYRAAIVE